MESSVIPQRKGIEPCQFQERKSRFHNDLMNQEKVMTKTVLLTLRGLDEFRRDLLNRKAFHATISIFKRRRLDGSLGTG